MAAVADQLVIELTARIDRAEADIRQYGESFSREMRRLEESSERAERGAGKSFGGIGEKFGKLAGAMGFSIADITSGVMNGIIALTKYAGGLNDTARSLGVTTDQLQQYRYAADVSGVSNKALEGGLASLRDKLGEAGLGAEKPIKMFKTLGIEIRDATGKIKTTGETFPELADRLNAIDDPAQRAATAALFLGDAAEELEPLVRQGSKGMDALAESANRLGIVMSAEEIQKADEAAQKLDDVRRVLQAEIASTVANNAKSIVALANALASLAGKILGFWNTNPERALAIIGGLGGLALGGPIAAGVGVAGGYYLGREQRFARDDENMDINFRTRQLGNAKAELAARQEKPFFRVRRGKHDQSGGTIEQALAEVERQRALLKRAHEKAREDARRKVEKQEEDAKAKPKPDVSNLLASERNKGRSGPSAESLAKKAEEERRRQLREDVQFSNDQDAIRLQILASQTEINGTEKDRLDLAKAQVTNTRVRDERNLQLDFERSEADKAILKALYKEREAIELKAIDTKKQLSDQKKESDAIVNDIRRKSEVRKLEAQLATTAKERRAIELELLDLQYQEAEERLKLLAASKDAAIAAEARKDLKALGEKKGLEKRNIEKNSKSPIEAYLDEIPDTAAEIDQALEGIAVGALTDIEDGFAGAATKALGLKGAIGTVVQELIKLAMKKYVIDALFGLLGISKKGGSAVDGARAFGGPVKAGGTYLVGERGPEILRMGAQGGVVIPNHQIAAPGGGGTTVVQNFTLDARGGITTPQLLAQVNNTITQAGTAAALAGGMEGERRVMKRASRRIPW